jgi:2-oxoglutarate dehydrogenase E1 component
MEKTIETVLSGSNSTYLLQLLEQFQLNPDSVAHDWVPILEDLSKNFPFVEKKPSWGMSFSKDVKSFQKELSEPAQKNISEDEFLNTARSLALIQAFRHFGHLGKSQDPLGLEKTKYVTELDFKSYGFKDADLSKTVFVNGFMDNQSMVLSDLLFHLKKIYSSSFTVEYSHIQNSDEREWFVQKIEGDEKTFSADEKKEILKDLTKAEFFEKIVHVKFPGAKRFGLDGGESLIPGIEALLRLKAKKEMCEVVFGMAHRGRLSVLTNVFNKPYRSIFSQFEGMSAIPDDMNASSDVKYHLGYSTDRVIENKKIHFTLLANPSHLEAVNPVTLGKIRSEQDLLKDEERKKVLGILIHGDAAFIGQGVVFESLNLSCLEGYKTGGTIHIIINNQIGFTTFPEHSRSTTYSSDTAKYIEAPILHVNGDEPEDVLRAFQMACDYHSTFGKDVVIDLICYRRFGHNEGDEPAYTQPLMYKKIQSHPSVRSQYEKYLLQKGYLNQEEAQTIQDDVQLKLQSEFNEAQKDKNNQLPADKKADWLADEWKNIAPVQHDEKLLEPVKTGVDIAILRALGLKALSVPHDFNLNSKILRQWEQKRNALNKGEGIDWALAESLAFATSLLEGHKVRLSGQDSERGTFSQRHLVVTDQENGNKYTSLNHLQSGQAYCEAINSPLSEFAVLGFEYGYSLASPNNLVLWEAQFGDFANGAQVIFDQFISSSEMKWLRLSNIVVLLPHGFEGQGPEHSSARLERFLQLCAENNMIVANCSTPANYFHILRRQLKALYRKPLILMTPKSLLRHPLCVSTLKDMGTQTSFLPVISDKLAADDIQKIVICSGKIYYDLLEKRQKEDNKTVALIRLEQFYPFPEKALLDALKQYKKAPVMWCQEEPENMGGWHFLDRRIEKVLTEWAGELMRPLYMGRKEAASPAVGLLSRHKSEQEEIVRNVFL